MVRLMILKKAVSNLFGGLACYGKTIPLTCSFYFCKDFTVK